MKALMIEVVNRVFTSLAYPEAVAGLRTATQAWDRPKLDAKLMARVRRLQANASLAAPDDVAP